MKENHMDITSETIDTLNDVASEILETAIDEPILLDDSRELVYGGGYGKQKHERQADNYALVNAARGKDGEAVAWDGIILHAVHSGLAFEDRYRLVYAASVILSAVADMDRADEAAFVEGAEDNDE